MNEHLQCWRYWNFLKEIWPCNHFMQFDGDHFISCTGTPGGGFGVFTDRDQRSIFFGFEFRESVRFGLLNKICILKCFILSKVFLGPVLFTRCFNNHGSPLLSHDAWVSRNEKCIWGHFLGFCFSESLFGFSVSGKVFFGSFRNT